MARSSSLREFEREVYRVVRKIPRGRVATYGQIAELAGMPGAARQVGAALSRLQGSTARAVPWQRVLGKRTRAAGRISILDPVGGALQRKRLEAEGVEVSDAGSVSLARFGWLPVDP